MAGQFGRAGGTNIKYCGLECRNPLNNAVIYSALMEETFLRSLDRLQPLALLVLRVVLGVIMIGHGYGKVFGGLSHHAQFVGSLGLPGWLAYCSAAAEFFG